MTDADEAVVTSHNGDELRRFIWDYVGIVHTSKRLEHAANRIALLQGEIKKYDAHFHANRDLIELRNLLQVADLIVRSAQARHESRDYPELLPRAPSTALSQLEWNTPPSARID